MTEAEWQVCSHPLAMLDVAGERLSTRKLRLLACACGRRVWPSLPNNYGHDMLQIAERLADLGQPLTPAVTEFVLGRLFTDLDEPTFRPSLLNFWVAGTSTLRRAFDGVRTSPLCDLLDAASLADLLRELLGPLPFRPVVLDPQWLTWNDGCVRRMAEAIYEERRFADLPLLADALLDAGCDQDDLLRHLWRPDGHVLGCWALDRILGRE